MVVLGILLLICFVLLLGRYHCLLHCPRCGRLSPQLTDEKNSLQETCAPKFNSPQCCYVYPGITLEIGFLQRSEKVYGIPNS